MGPTSAANSPVILLSGGGVTGGAVAPDREGAIRVAAPEFGEFPKAGIGAMVCSEAESGVGGFGASESFGSSAFIGSLGLTANVRS